MAEKLASMISVDAPTVVHLRSPSVLSISTRTREPAACPDSSTRTL